MSGGILATVAAPIRVTLAGSSQTWEVQTAELMADSWLEALLQSGTTWGRLLVDVLPDDGMGVVVDALLTGDLPPAAISVSCKELVTVAAGRDWWEAINIITIADEVWDSVGGEMATKGIIPSRVTFGVWLDAVWLILRKLWKQQGDTEYSQLIAEVKRRPLESDESDDPEVDGVMDANDFMAAAGELRGHLPG